MAKKDKKQKKQYGMGPGQSMAMAGNTGLASFKEKDINRVQQEKRAYNEFSGRDRNERASFTDIGQEIGELGSKYRRPVKIADGFGAYSDGSGRAYTPNDFNADGSFRSFTATQPTAREVFGRGGDFRRAFTGYNSINYDNPGQGYSPVSMQRTPGMIEQGILSPLTTMAKAALSATNDLAGKVKPLYSGTVDLFKEGVGALNDVQQQIFMNPKKYKFARNQEEIIKAEEKEDEVNRLETLNEKIEADRKQFEDLLNISVQQDQFTGTGQSYMDTKENFNSRIPSDNSIVFNRQKDMMKSSNPFEKDRNIEQFIPRNNQEIINNSDLIDQTFLDNILNTSGTGQSATDTKDNFNSRIPPGITSLVNDLDASNIVTEDDRNNTILDQINNFPKITPYNNPFNLEFRNQNKATPGYGGDDGQRFASFPDVNTGLKEGFDRVSEIVGDGRSTKSFLDIYAPRSDNEESYDNYLKELVKRVGYTIEPDEVKDLGETIIKQENTSKISDQYLDYLQTNANKVFNSGIVS